MLLSSFQPFTMRLFGLEYSLLAFLYALLLLSTLVSPTLTAIFSFRPLRALGTVAYGLYLFHGLVSFVLFSVLDRIGLAGSQIADFSAWLLTVPLSIGLAALSWKYFEKPLVKRGHRYLYGDRKTSLQNVGSTEKSVMQNAS
jgi:peptidoglycan/LPS O-acetylase OafA/YrhL